SRPDPAWLPPIPGAEAQAVDRKKEDEQKHLKVSNQAETLHAPVNSEQENGVQPDRIINYRNLNGPDNQPEPNSEVPVTNYRELQGPQNQPKGENPKK
ncbi:MAG: hypothetical protein K9H15_16065, partial [Bacteroidales bacterium]|nr:hypothetical protein [Bacteroidales bacterium]